MAQETTSLLQPAEVDGSSSFDNCEELRLKVPPVLEDLPRHLHLPDLVAIGVGGTVGSGIYVLCGLIAREYAGPATFISWAIAGCAACLSGFCCAELAGKIPEAGSAYSYASVTLGEYPAFIAACCLSLNYVGSASAVARSWGDKVTNWAVAELGEEHWFSRFCDPLPLLGFSTMAFVISSASVTLLLKGVEESKWMTNVFTILKVFLISFMVVLGAYLADFPTNMYPLIPTEFGVGGIFRGSTSCFFGYIGFDEACCLAGEAINPQKNMPRAIQWTISIVAVLYMTAAIVLVGMKPYSEISDVSAFPDAFRYNGVEWAARIASAGEIITLPIVVLISILAQPRLAWAVAKDGLLPSVFAEVNEKGNLWKGTAISGAIMVAIASFIPFTFLDDTISTGILLAFCISNWSVITLRYKDEDDGEHPITLDWLLLAFNVLSLLFGRIAQHCADNTWGRILVYASSGGLLVLLAAILCLPKTTGVVNDGHYHAPFVPLLPCVGIFINWYLVAQLEITGILLLLAYLLVGTVFYFSYGIKRSRRKLADGANQRGRWKSYIAGKLELAHVAGIPKEQR